MKNTSKISWITSIIGVIIVFTALSCGTTSNIAKPYMSNDGLYRYIENKEFGGISITDYFGNEKELVIPNEIDGKPVVEIRMSYDKSFFGAFQDKGLTSVTIPNGVIKIWQYSFNNNNLTSIIIPDSVTELSGFYGNQLTNITIPARVTQLSGFGNNPLTNVTFSGTISGVLAREALGDLTIFYAANNRKPGNYTLTEDRWHFNGNLIEIPAVIIMPTNISLQAINGNNALLMNVGERNTTGIGERYCFLPAGTHSIDVRHYYYGAGWKEMVTDGTFNEIEFISGIIYRITVDSNYRIGLAAVGSLLNEE